ncbi:MAG: cation:proton antiporter [Thermoplasmata archaeon]|nr:cation:proton antiporter [Thermoplasmata archaeon]
MHPEVDVFLLTFSFVVFIALVIPEVVRRSSLTPVPLFIVAGILVGPHGLGLIELEPAIYDIGRLGLFFLVFLAGLEAHSSRGSSGRRFIVLVLTAGGTCFAGGYAMATAFGFPPETAFLFGAILVSSSVGEIIPMVTSNYQLRERIGTYIVPAVVALDAASLIMLSMVLQVDRGPAEFALFAGLAVLFIVFSYMWIPRAARWFFSRYERTPEESETRFVLTVLFYFIAVSTLLGIHGIVAAFIAGLVLGESMKGHATERKVRAIGHGFLIPIFFINIGLETDLVVVLDSADHALLVVAVIGTLVSTKLIGGLLFALLARRQPSEGLAAGVVLLPQLSATLAAAEIGKQANIIPDDLFAAVVVMCISSALATPFIVTGLWGRREEAIPYSDHIVVLGAGRTGSDVIQAVAELEENLIVVDRDVARVRQWGREWVACILGDATEVRTLRNAAVQRAKLVIATLPRSEDTVVAVRNVRRLNARCRVIVRIHDAREREMLREDVDTFIEPEAVTAFNMIWHMYEYLGEEKGSARAGR